MISFDEALTALAECLETDVPSPDGRGTRVFGLSEDMRLGVEALPGGAGLLAWSEAGTAEGRDTEEKAAGFLRVRLARLRGSANIEATRDDGRLLLFWRGRPEAAQEWLDAVTTLLNEAETARRLLSGSGGTPPTVASLYSGMAGLWTFKGK